MKLAVVVQRYGAEINGGAELHARYVAELLASRHQVRVLTTCATDYVTWRNDLPPGDTVVNGVPVRRFPVAHERSPEEFGRRSELVFESMHSLADEIAWLESEGPASPALIRAIARSQGEYDFLVFFSYRYHHAWHGIRAAPQRALLVPTAERDLAIGLSLFPPVFRAVRALMYNSFEERAMIHAAAGNEAVPGVVVGVGSAVPDRTDPARFRAAYGLTGPYVVYVGRIDENKGCAELFAWFTRHVAARRSPLTLVLIGRAVLPVPDHPRIRHLGFLPDQDKFDAIAGAEALVMPSYYESLSMVALEAWGLGRPVLANARCDVLKGQAVRSNAGLYYDGFDEFSEALQVLTTRPRVNAALGANGRAYFRQHYAWPVVAGKYDEMLAQLEAENARGEPLRTMPPMPGWFARRRRNLPPAREVAAALPSGAVVRSRTAHGRELRARSA